MKRIMGIFLTIVIAILVIVISTKKSYIDYEHNQYINIRTDMVSHIIDNTSLYEAALKEWGYYLKVCYKVGDEYNWDEDENKRNLDFEEKLGYQDRGILVLLQDNITYCFDRGLRRIFVDVSSGVALSIALDVDELPLAFNNERYAFSVILSAPEYDEKGYSTPFNDYNMDFTDYRIIWDGEMVDDYRIKAYVSAEELQDILERGIELEQQLIDLYLTLKN